MSDTITLLHFADAHLGYAGNASKHNEFSSLRINKEIDGVNVRTLDVNDAFKQVIDLAIQHNVDYVVDAGDLFDQWGYKANSIYNTTQTEILRLLEHQIKYVGIIGNHDLPKLKNKGTYSEALNAFPHVHLAYTGFYERFYFEDDNIAFHGVPSSFRQDILDESLAAVEKIEGAINVGIGHFGVTTIKHYAESAVNSLVVDLDRLIAKDMNYFALGDYHSPTDFGYNIHYSGSLVNLGFGELGNVPRVNLVTINKNTGDVDVKPLFINTRPMIELPHLDVKGLEIEEVNNKIKEVLASNDLTDKIVRFRVKHLSKDLKKLVDADMIAQLTEEALYFKIEFVDTVDKMNEASTGGSTFSGVLEGWGDFIDSIENDGTYDKEELKKAGYDKLSEVMDMNS